MALIHNATLQPTKLDLLADWLPSRDWFVGGGGAVTRVAGYRFDDPAGEVGMETMLVQAGDGPVHQVPLTYRGAPLPAGDGWLIGTSEHSVLGRRWIYDALGDPTYAAALAAAILAGTGQAEELMDVDGRLVPQAPTMTITSTGPAGNAPAAGSVRTVTDGDPALIRTDTVELAVRRRLDDGAAIDGAVLTGTWPTRTTAVPLAYATF